MRQKVSRFRHRRARGDRRSRENCREGFRPRCPPVPPRASSIPCTSRCDPEYPLSGVFPTSKSSLVSAEARACRTPARRTSPETLELARHARRPRIPCGDQALSRTHYGLGDRSGGPKGAYLAILRPSGCGKTTCLRMIGGSEQPSEGTVRIGGVTINGVPAQPRPVNIVFQRHGLFPRLDVTQNVAYGLKQRRPRIAGAESAGVWIRHWRSSASPASAAPRPRDVGRPAAAGGAGACHRQPAADSAAGRAAGRAGPQAQGPRCRSSS